MKTFVQGLVRFLLKYYILVIVISFLTLFFSLPRMMNLFKNISTDSIDLLPKNFQSVQTLLKIRDKFEGKISFSVVMESDDPGKTKQALADYAQLLSTDPQVDKVFYKKTAYDFFDRSKLLFMDLEDLIEIKDRIDRKIQTSKLGSLYIDFENSGKEELDFSDIEKKYQDKYGVSQGSSEFFESPDGKMFLLNVESKKGNYSVAQQSEFENRVYQLIEKKSKVEYGPSFKLYIAGANKVKDYKTLISDLQVAGMVSLVLIFLPLLIRFRRPVPILIIFIPLFLSIPLSLAISSYSIPKLNVITSFLFAILGGLGVETGIHLYSRFYEQRRAGLSIQEALEDLYLYQGPAIFTAVGALSSTFLLMIFSDFRGFSEFGEISAMGLIVVCLFYFSFFPSLLILVEKLNISRLQAAAKEIETNYPFPPQRGWKIILAFFALFSILSLYLSPQIEFEYDSNKIRNQNQAQDLGKQKQREIQGGAGSNPAISLIRNEEEGRIIENYVEEYKKNHPDNILGSVRSLHTLVPDKQDEKMEVIHSLKEILADPTLKLVKDEKKKDLERFKDSLKRTQKLSLEDVPSEIKDAFYGKANPPGLVAFIHAKPGIELADGRNAMKLADAVKKMETAQGVFYASSDAIVFSDVLKTMLKDSKKVILFSVLTLLVFSYLQFRSLKKALLVLFPILSGLIWVFACMKIFGVKMNLYNLVMIPSIMGMSIDNSIHIYHSYEEKGRGSLPEVMKSAGLSSLLASLTNASGFIGLLFCSHGGLKSMGVVASIGVVSCLVATLVFFPILLQFLEKFSVKS